MSRALIIAVGLLVGVGLWYWWTMNSQISMSSPQNPEIEVLTNTGSKTETAATKLTPDSKQTQTYRNEEYGFEFEYPREWNLATNVFYSPFSKINLTVSLPGDNNVVLYSFLVNIVTPEFADNALVSKARRGAVESAVVVDGIQGKRHEYIMDGGLAAISVDIPIGEYRALIVADKKHEAEFNQILTSFKFLR